MAIDPIEQLAKAFPPPGKKRKPDAGVQTRDPYAQQNDDYDDGEDADRDDSDTSVDEDDAVGTLDDESAYEDEDNEAFEDPDAGDADGDGVDDEADLDDDGDGQPDEGSFTDADGAGDDGDFDEAPPSGGQGGDVTALVQKLAALERDYYAAKGMHGAGHHKTEMLLDQYHRVVRDLVRVTMGSQAQPGQPEPDGDEDGEGFGDDDGDEGGDNPFAGSGAEPFGGDDEVEEADGDDENAQRVQKQRPGDQDKPKAKKKPPFGKSQRVDPISMLAPVQAKKLRKGLYHFASSRGAKLKGEFLMPYLVAFIEEAYEDCARMCEAERYDVDAMACKIMCKLVEYMPDNVNLRAAAEKYRITQEGIAKLLRDRGIVTAEEIEAARIARNDEDASLVALGAESLTQKSWFDVDDRDPLLKGAEGVRGVQRAHARAADFVVVDDPVDPSAAFAKSRRPAILSLYENDTPVKVNIDGGCLLHGHSDLTKSQNLWNPHARCTCPH